MQPVRPPPGRARARQGSSVNGTLATRMTSCCCRVRITPAPANSCSIAGQLRCSRCNPGVPSLPFACCRRWACAKVHRIHIEKIGRAPVIPIRPFRPAVASQPFQTEANGGRRPTRHGKEFTHDDRLFMCASEPNARYQPRPWRPAGAPAPGHFETTQEWGYCGFHTGHRSPARLPY